MGAEREIGAPSTSPTVSYPAPLEWEAQYNLWLQLAAESGVGDLEGLVARVRATLAEATTQIRSSIGAATRSDDETDDLGSIRASRPPARPSPVGGVDESMLRNRLLGALAGRCAGCTLGAAVELQPVTRVESWARRIGQEFPPTRYWLDVDRPDDPAYVVSTRREFVAEHMTAVPADDDIAYTLMGLLILEEYGPTFTIDDVASAWLRWLPFADTAERVTLSALRAGHPAPAAGDTDNPYVHMIGGDIRSDPWGYVAAGAPVLAAELAHRDASLTHRRTGVHAAMYFAAVIAAAFAVDDPADALRVGLGEIPRDCWFAQEVRWALDAAHAVRDHRDAHALVVERFEGMHPVHSVNNACLVIFGVTIGGRDFTKAIGETVAMGFDNDCTAATVGSIVGAVVGIDGVPAHWWHPFRNRIRTYLVGNELFEIDDVVDRFLVQRHRLLAT